MLLKSAVIACLILLLPVAHPARAGAVVMETIPYGGWPRCIRLSNPDVELVVTTDVGPRIMRYGFKGGQNLFKEFRDQTGKTGGKEWRIYGGHRMWHAPEAQPRSYAPDNDPVQYHWNGVSLCMFQNTEPSTGIAKEMVITLAPTGTHVTVLHTLVNNNLWTIRTAAWAMTTMAQNGRAIFPQEPEKPYPAYLPPARPMTLWHYTDMSDARWTWGRRFIQLQQDPRAKDPEKIALRNSLGWSAYALNGQVFLKRFGYDACADYPDFGCNNATFTNADMIEIESLGPLTDLAPGGKAECTEHWFLFQKEVGKDDEAIERDLLPLVGQTEEGSRPLNPNRAEVMGKETGS